ncbi:hypothetical protein [Caenispirillum bisanense]|uniref:Holin-X, holin superfamily III n=1 Tax=Caenispirillum bisanense TaxID=414052 RepID=A0A286H079_9PROT|nr:hypothetical protein [Caenispirillum bisanense]SOE01151.1 hypothetical protein SAMN05421508_11644 [Caenispirillum bisanense]
MAGKGAKGRAGGAGKAPRPPGAPTPDERAEVVVTKLERFIREKRSASAGVSFKSWQAMAKQEIADAVRAVEGEQAKDSRVLDRLVLLGGAALSTIGVWGTALAIGQAPDRVWAAVAIMAAGFVLLWIMGALFVRSPLGRFRDERRQAALRRMDDLHRQVRRLENELKARAKGLQKELDAHDLDPS